MAHFLELLELFVNPTATSSTRDRTTQRPSPTRPTIASDRGASADALDVAQKKSQQDDRIQWFRCLPFLLMHIACLSVFLVGWNWIVVGVALGLFVVRAFGITGFYHRYFSHHAFKTSRPVQFLGGVLGNAAVQRGPIWWASHHRQHHQHSDTGQDAHSPEHHGFWFSHMGWFMTRNNYSTIDQYVPDLLKYPELRFINRFDWLVPLLLAGSLFGAGELLRLLVPDWGVTGVQMFVWGFLISTVVLYHTTFSVNSLAHKFGSRPYPTRDDSRNSFLLALFTFGEGWHNNHHYYPNAARNGFRWWEYDPTYYTLVLMSWLGIVWDLKKVPKHALDSLDVNGNANVHT